MYQQSPKVMILVQTIHTVTPVKTILNIGNSLLFRFFRKTFTYNIITLLKKSKSKNRKYCEKQGKIQ